MVGKGNVVEIVIDIVYVESRPPPVTALQALDPFHAALDGVVIARPRPDPAGTVHRHDNDGRVIEIRIVRIGILKSPAARPDLWAPETPIADNIEHLARQ